MGKVLKYDLNKLQDLEVSLEYGLNRLQGREVSLYCNLFSSPRYDMNRLQVGEGYIV